MGASHVSKTFHDMLKTMFGSARETTKNISNNILEKLQKTTEMLYQIKRKQGEQKLARKKTYGKLFRKKLLS